MVGSKALKLEGVLWLVHIWELRYCYGNGLSMSQ